MFFIAYDQLKCFKKVSVFHFLFACFHLQDGKECRVLPSMKMISFWLFNRAKRSA